MMHASPGLMHLTFPYNYHFDTNGIMSLSSPEQPGAADLGRGVFVASTLTSVSEYYTV